MNRPSSSLAITGSYLQFLQKCTHSSHLWTSTQLNFHPVSHDKHRILILNICVSEHENQTFLEYLKSKNLTDNLIHYVVYAIAMATDATPCPEGMLRVQKFLQSLGRYGNTPFLWPMYGSGEIPQAFCR